MRRRRTDPPLRVGQAYVYPYIDAIFVVVRDHVVLDGEKPCRLWDIVFLDPGISTVEMGTISEGSSFHTDSRPL